MDETELGSMVVRLIGDVGQYQSSMDEAAKISEETAKDIEEHGNRIEDMSGKIEGYAAAALGGLAAIGASGWLKNAFGEFDEAQSTAIRLSAVLEANGRNVQALMADYRDFAAEMQRTTTMGDDQVLALVKQAESFNLTGDAAKKAVQDAMALAAVNGSSADSMIRITAAMAQGDTKRAMMFSRMIPQLRGVKDETEFLAKWQKLTAAGMSTLNAEASTGSGVLKQLKNMYGDLMEEFGEVIESGLKPIVTWIKMAVTWFQELSPGIKQTIVVVTMLVAGLAALGPIIAIVGLIAPLIFNPLVLIIAAVSAAIGVAIWWVGGFGKAWELVKTAATSAFNYVNTKIQELIAFLQPIIDAAVSLFWTLWDTVKQVFGYIWELAQTVFNKVYETLSEVWDKIVEKTGLSWTAIRDHIQDFVLFAEFYILNFSRFMDLAWVEAQLGAVTFQNNVTHVFNTLVQIVQWFGNNWQSIFAAVFDYTVGWAKNIVNLITNLPALIKGELSFADVWTPILGGLKDTFSTFPAIAGRELGPLEKQLMDQVEGMRGALGKDFEKFRDDKLKEFADKGLAEKVVPGKFLMEHNRKAGEDGGAALAKGVAKGVEMAQGVLAGSAEAISRVAAFRDADRGDTKRVGAVGGAAPAAMGNLPRGGGGAGGGDNPTNKLLTEIRDHLAAMRLEGGGIAFVEAGLG